MKWKKGLMKVVKWVSIALLALILTTSLLIYFYKDRIINYAVGEINKFLTAEVKVEKIDLTFWSTFPNVSIDFNKVLINDAFPGEKSSDTLLYTELIRLKFKPIDLWNEKYDVKKAVITNGVLKLRVNEKSEDNYHILKESKDSKQSSFKLSLQKIEANNIRFLYTNALSEVKYKAQFETLAMRGDFTQDQFDIESESNFRIQKIQHGLVPFVTNKNASASLTISVNNKKNSLSIQKGKLVFAKIPLDFNLGLQKNQLQFSINGNNIPIEKLVESINAKELETVSQVNGSGNANIQLTYKTELKKDAYPEIESTFSIRNGKLTEPIKKLTLNHINLVGSLSTSKGKGNEWVQIEKLSFSTISGPFAGAIRIENFILPSYSGHAKGSVDLEVIQSIFKLPKIELLSGKVDVNTRFSLQTKLTEKGNQLEIVDGNGIAQLTNASLQLQNDSRKFQEISGNLLLNKSNAVLEDLHVRLGESDLTLNGNFDNIDLFLQDKSSLAIAVIAESNKINLSDFNNNIQLENTVVSSQKEWILPTKIIGTVKLNINAIQLNQHLFTQISGDMTLGERNVLIEKLHGVSANATVNGTLAVVETAPEYFQLATNLSSKDIYFKPIFKEWNNFEQKMISADNINGRAEAILDLKAPFDLRYGILKDEIEAQIQMKIISGQLKGVEAFKTLTKDLKNTKAKLILNKEDISSLEQKLGNISFDTLQNTLFIKKGTIIIPKMIIKSSVIAISLEAKHQFNNNIDYKFSFRFRDLKTKKDESEFGIVEDDGTGVNIFVRMFGNIENPTIVWDKMTRKEETKGNIVDAKKEAMSMLKSELGLFKKDTTVNKYQPKKQEHEVLQIEFGKEDKINPYEEKKELEKEKKGLKKLGEALKNQKRENEEEFTVE